jgi:hypothetical protein
MTHWFSARTDFQQSVRRDVGTTGKPAHRSRLSAFFDGHLHVGNAIVTCNGKKQVILLRLHVNETLHPCRRRLISSIGGFRDALQLLKKDPAGARNGDIDAHGAIA